MQAGLVSSDSVGPASAAPLAATVFTVVPTVSAAVSGRYESVAACPTAPGVTVTSTMFLVQHHRGDQQVAATMRHFRRPGEPDTTALLVG
jgi:hypothetical protein